MDFPLDRDFRDPLPSNDCPECGSRLTSLGDCPWCDCALPGELYPCQAEKRLGLRTNICADCQRGLDGAARCECPSSRQPNCGLEPCANGLLCAECDKAIHCDGSCRELTTH